MIMHLMIEARTRLERSGLARSIHAQARLYRIALRQSSMENLPTCFSLFDRLLRISKVILPLCLGLFLCHMRCKLPSLFPKSCLKMWYGHVASTLCLMMMLRKRLGVLVRSRAWVETSVWRKKRQGQRLTFRVIFRFPDQSASACAVTICLRPKNIFSIMKEIFRQSAVTTCLVDSLYLRNQTIHQNSLSTL